MCQAVPLQIVFLALFTYEISNTMTWFTKTFWKKETVEYFLDSENLAETSGEKEIVSEDGQHRLQFSTNLVHQVSDTRNVAQHFVWKSFRSV